MTIHDRGPDAQVGGEFETEFELRKINSLDHPDVWVKMGQLRAQSYIDTHHFLPESARDENGAEFDEYDSDPRTSHFVIVGAGGEVIGTSRVIYRDKDTVTPLPSEELFSIATTDGPAREVSRLITDRNQLPAEHRRSAQHLKLYLMRAMTQEGLSRPDAGPLYAILETPLLRSLQEIGVAMNVLGEPLFSKKYNSSNILVEFRLEDMTREMHQADERRVALFPSRKERFGPFMEGQKSELGLGRMALTADFLQAPREQHERNYGWLNEKEHQRVAESIVAIAGVGGDGGALAVQLARMGVKNFRLADPDPFEVENLNRQEGATYNTIHRNKAEVIAELIKEIQPFAEIDIYQDGVTPENIAAFVEGSHLVIDETEYTKHEIGVMIAREARRNGLPVLMGLNVGFGSYVTSFDPKGVSFEEYLGLSEDMTLEDIAKQEVPLWKWVPHIPSYADMNMFKKISSGEVSAPTIMPGVGVTAAHAAQQAITHLVRDISPARESSLRFAPRGQSIDIIDGSHNVRYPLVHFAKSALVALVRTRMGRNPPMD